MPAVTALASVRPPPSIADEPAFGLDEGSRLRPSGRWSPESAGGYLARAIARDPGDLRRHVRRVALWTASARADEIYGALIDLYVALGACGAALRERMLGAAAASLADDQRAFLSGRLGAGLAATDPHPPAPTSVLTRAVTGRLDTITRLGTADAGSAFEPLREAREFLAEGNLARAREILEDALRDDPAHIEIGRELVAIYRHSRDLTRLEAIRRELGDRLAEPATWAEASAALRPGSAV